jgi:hypothetical protein
MGLFDLVRITQSRDGILLGLVGAFLFLR